MNFTNAQYMTQVPPSKPVEMKNFNFDTTLDSNRGSNKGSGHAKNNFSLKKPTPGGTKGISMKFAN